jgi:hypothetical protein
MPAGRPLKFESVEDLRGACAKYIASCSDAEGKPVKPITITGLAIALKTCRQTLLNYEERPEFMDTIREAKLHCENFAEEQLFMGRNPAGAKFALEANYKWNSPQTIKLGNEDDKPLEVNHSGSIDVVTRISELMK